MSEEAVFSALPEVLPENAFGVCDADVWAPVVSEFGLDVSTPLEESCEPGSSDLLEISDIVSEPSELFSASE